MLNFASYFFAPGGWGTHARSFAGALHRLTPIALDYWHNPRSLTDLETGVAEILAANLSPAATAPTIAIVPDANIPPMVGRYKIGFFVWETSRIPDHFCQALDRFDALWVPSLWQRQVAIQSGLAADRIRVVPEGVDPLVFCPADRPADPDRPFRFVTVGKWERRKGIDLAIAAFARAFGPRDRVELVLHSHNSYQPGFELREAITRAAQALGADPSRIQPSYPQGRSHLVELLQQADAFLLPTRGEGWGLPILEAMACGLPCIVTDWSGLRAYAHPGNSYLIPVKSLVPVDDPLFFDPALNWGCWAEPDLEAIVALMQQVYRDRAGARRVGAIARAEATTWWTWDHAAQTALAHLSQLCP